MNNEKIKTNEILSEIVDETQKEIDNETEEIKEKFNQPWIDKHSIMRNVFMLFMRKLLNGLSIKLTVIYKEKVLFEYVFPKN